MAREGTDLSDQGLPRSYVRPCLLLLLSEAPSHGYELLEQVRELGVRNADAGGLYRTLRSMEQEGLVTSWWEPSSSGPARRTYTVSGEGTVALRGAVASLRDVHRTLGRFIGRYERTTSPARSRRQTS